MKLKQLADITLDDIYAFLENNTEVMDEGMANYLNLMDKVRSMHYRVSEFGSKKLIVQHLVKVEGLSYYLANRIYNDALEYFWVENGTSKQAWRNVIAEFQETLINMALQMAKDVNDLAKISSMNKVRYEMRELHKDDPIELPDELFRKPFNIYAFDGEQLQLETVPNSEELSDFIKSLPDLTERQRRKIRQEAGLEPLTLFTDEARSD